MGVQLDTWYFDVVEVSNGSMSYYTSCKGVTPSTYYERIFKWTPPPSTLYPGEKISMTLTAMNGKVQTGFNEHGGIGAGFEPYGMKIGGTCGGISLGRTGIDKNDGEGAYNTVTTEAEVPNAGYGGEEKKMQINVGASSPNSAGSLIGYIYVYGWQEGADITETTGLTLGLNVTGTYKCRDGMMYLNQIGNTVSGNYDWSGGGVVSGTLKGNTLYGTWTDGGGTGDIQYVFSADGSQYEHLWRFTGESEWRTAGPSIKQ